MKPIYQTEGMKLFLLLTVFVMFIQSCTKDNGPCGGNATYYYLTDVDKAKVPYTGNDTLVFISNSNDTATCIGQSKKLFYTTKSFSVNAGECEDDTYYYEAYNYKFVTNRSNLKMEINIYKDDLSGSGTIHFLKNQIDFTLYLDHIDLKKAINFIDSIKVKEIWYKNVSVSWKDYNPNLDKLYYNKEFGILKIQNADSTEIWELLNKK